MTALPPPKNDWGLMLTPLVFIMLFMQVGLEKIFFTMLIFILIDGIIEVIANFNKNNVKAEAPSKDEIDRLNGLKLKMTSKRILGQYKDEPIFSFIVLSDDKIYKYEGVALYDNGIMIHPLAEDEILLTNDVIYKLTDEKVIDDELRLIQSSGQSS